VGLLEARRGGGRRGYKGDPEFNWPAQKNAYIRGVAMQFNCLYQHHCKSRLTIVATHPDRMFQFRGPWGQPCGRAHIGHAFRSKARALALTIWPLQ
jgi:hypothetical protein